MTRRFLLLGLLAVTACDMTDDRSPAQQRADRERWRREDEQDRRAAELRRLVENRERQRREAWLKKH